jgi:hypothetical protein
VSGGDRSSRRRAVAIAAALGIVAVPLLLGLDSRSVQRGNRLYRGGDPASAAEVYGRALGPGSTEATAFNLGTALLALDADSAEVVLRASSQVEDRRLAQRGFYNLGYGQVLGAETAATPDSVLPSLRAAVSSYRMALRLDPTDQDARWNLALAIRRLEAMLPPGEDTGEESGGDSEDEVPMNDPQMARSETAPAESGPEPPDPRPTVDSGERSGPREGAREAWALQDPGPLTAARALELLAGVEDDPEVLLKGILWSHRPDIAWWTGQPYPGGAW